MTKKVILTGATGLIGKDAIAPLKDLGYEVFPINSKDCNLFDEEEIKSLLDEIKPKYLLHFASYTGEGYLASETNQEFLKAGLNLLKHFKNNGGERAVFAGTCFEYDFNNNPLKETDPLDPQTLYAKCKVELFRQAKEFCTKNEISFGWGRIFYVYGNNENPMRLTPYIIHNLKNGKPVEIKCGQLIKDYMYTKDVAAAFVKLLDSDVTGAVNICTGKGISLEEYSNTIAKTLNKENLLVVKYQETDQPLIVVGNNKILSQEIGFTPKYTIKSGIKEVINNLT